MSEKRTIETVKAEIKTAREYRAKFAPGTEDHKKADARVQALKAEKAGLEAATVGTTVKSAPKTKGKNGKPTVVVVLPPYPNFDHAIAFRREQLDMGKFFHLQLAFCHRNFPAEEEYKAWQAGCLNGREPVLIDVGDSKRKGFRSVAEMAKLSSSVEGGKAYNTLVEYANRLNESPDLWKARYSIPRLMQDLYFLREGDDDTEQKVFDRMMDVVRAYFRPQNARSWDSLFKDSRYKDDMLKLWQGFNITEAEVQPFTLTLYFRHLFCAGEDRKVIQEKIGWWIRKHRACDKKFRKLADKKFEVRPFTVRGKSAGLVSLGNYWDARSFQYQWLGSGVLNLAIVRNKLGHVVIQSSPKHRSANLSKLYKRLERDEPGRWWLHAPKNGRQVLMNGGFRYDGVRKTDKAAGELMRLSFKYIVL